MNCETCRFRLLDAAWIAGRDYFKFLLDWLRIVRYYVIAPAAHVFVV
jgi:hypothetical protein